MLSPVTIIAITGPEHTSGQKDPVPYLQTAYARRQTRAQGTMTFELIIIGTSAAAFLSGMLATEAYKALEMIYLEHRARVNHEIAKFGRPLKRKERKIMKRKFKLDQMAAALSVNTLNSKNSRRSDHAHTHRSGSERRFAPRSNYSDVPQPAPPPLPNPKHGPFADQSHALYIYDGPSSPDKGLSPRDSAQKKE
ncbi:hypothetical protein TWF703_000984 [Orbilia oligospora]|uniref:Uncharacterized protein n=2 Tax=Orbilia oligospora TaxID=2813651 RepID=A0A7C8JWM4_ORBOL|nr:hypothetical protein TWF703_000984 [Orbilia oligospora]